MSQRSAYMLVFVVDATCLIIVTTASTWTHKSAPVGAFGRVVSGAPKSGAARGPARAFRARLTHDDRGTAAAGAAAARARATHKEGARISEPGTGADQAPHRDLLTLQAQGAEPGSRLAVAAFAMARARERGRVYVANFAGR